MSDCEVWSKIQERDGNIVTFCWEAGGFQARIGFKTKKRKLKSINSRFSFKLDVGNELSSQAVARQVFSPLRIFTTVFGMGTGGFFSLGHQQTCVCCLPIILGFQRVHWKLHKIYYHHFLTNSWLLLYTTLSLTSFCFAKFPFVLLRASSSFGLRPHSTQNLFRKSPRPISNARLKMLPLLHLHPINVVIYNGTY